MKKPIVIGIDGGATKTVCRIMDINGDLLGYGKSGSGNILTAGSDVVYESICQALDQAICKLKSVEVGSICLGMAGSGNEQSHTALADLIEKLIHDKRLDVKWSVTSGNCCIIPDYEVALAGASPDGVGIVTIAGSGSVVFGRNRSGKILRVGGWGRLFSDEGSAYHIAKQAVRLIIRLYDSGKKGFPFAETVQRYFNVSGVPELSAAFASGRITGSELAGFAPHVDETAANGEPNARAVIEDAAVSLADSTMLVIKRLFNGDSNINVYTTGAVWTGISGIRNLFKDRLSELTGAANVENPAHDPAHGACILALKAYKENQR